MIQFNSWNDFSVFNLRISFLSFSGSCLVPRTSIATHCLLVNKTTREEDSLKWQKYGKIQDGKGFNLIKIESV